MVPYGRSNVEMASRLPRFCLQALPQGQGGWGLALGVQQNEGGPADPERCSGRGSHLRARALPLVF